MCDGEKAISKEFLLKQQWQHWWLGQVNGRKSTRRLMEGLRRSSEAVLFVRLCVCVYVCMSVCVCVCVRESDMRGPDKFDAFEGIFKNLQPNEFRSLCNM